jgi:asparagine synthase (glutamine-hydrolysing)
VHPYFLSRTLFPPKTRSELMPSTSDETGRRADEPLHESLRQTEGLDAVNRVSYLESRCYMLNTLLRDSDVMSMAHGLELRVPLIDHKLAQQVMALPGAWKLEGSTPKALLVAALKGTLPDSILRRPKRGFTLPFDLWMRDRLRSAVESSLKRVADGPLGECLSAERAQEVWSEFLRGGTSWSRPWALFVLQRWCEQNLT